MKNSAKIWEIVLRFSNNCIWIGIVKLSLLGSGDSSWVANVLTKRLKIWHVNKRDIFEHNSLAIDESIWERCCNLDLNTVWARLPYCLSKNPLKRIFLDIYLTTFSESVTSKIEKLWGSPFDSKCLKFKVDFKNAAKNTEKTCYFWDNIIWIGVVKLSLWRTRYFSSAANVLRSNPEVLHVNKKDFFQLNWLGTDWWIV